MNVGPLGRLRTAPLRETWLHEAHAFTVWLAETANLALLSEELDLEITLIQTEASIGKFNADILAEQTGSGKKIIIENQLEATDHDHLGKLITYASGVDAEFVVWIVAGAREEHKRAVDWLNEHTDERLNFFLIQIELWQIGDSEPGPKFNVVSQPNNRAKTVKRSAAVSDTLTSTKLRQLEFWENFIEFAKARKTRLSLRRPRPQHWYDLSSGSSYWHVALTLNTAKQTMACEVYIPKDKVIFDKFRQHQNQIEKHLGVDIEWMELSDKKASRIKQTAPAVVDMSDMEKWPQYFEWLLYRAESFRKTFGEIK